MTSVRAHAQRRARRDRPRRRRPYWPEFYFGFAESAERERLYIEHVLRPHAERVSAEITARLRDDLSFRGEAFVKVGWDLDRQAATYERIDPSDVLATPPFPAETRRLAHPWRP